MTNTFYFADPHFGHAGIINFESTRPFRPFATIEEHDEEIIRRWNARVNPRDRVFLLGDVSMGSRHIARCAELNGDKRLVMGNHDRFPTLEYLKYFKKCYGAVVLYDNILTHIPVHPCQLTRWKLNIHGHMHTCKIDDPRYVCVSAEQVNLTPISHDELMKEYGE